MYVIICNKCDIAALPNISHVGTLRSEMMIMQLFLSIFVI